MQLSQAAAVGYVIWRYVWKPWTVMRADVQALAQEQQDVRSEMKLRKTLYLGDEQLAQAESKAQLRSWMRGLDA